MDLHRRCKATAGSSWHARAMTTSTTTTTTERFLDALASGQGMPAELFAGDAVLDATVPGWRFPLRGAAAVAEKLSAWYCDPGSFEELERRPFDGGETITYTFSAADQGVPYAVHQCHVLHFAEDGRIARDVAFCGGRWGAELLAEMAAAEIAG